MRNLTVCILLLPLLVGVANAQSTEFGVLLSGNAATFDGNAKKFQSTFSSFEGSSPSFEHRIRARIGGFMRLPVSKTLAIRQEIAFSLKGTAFSDSKTEQGEIGFGENARSVTTTTEINVTAEYGYIETPVLAEYIVPTGTDFKPYLLAGPSIGFSVFSTEEISLEGLGSTNTREVDASSVDLGAVIGGGIKYPFDSGRSIMIDVRYNPSFTDNQGARSVDLKNRVFSVGVGFFSLFSL